MKKDQHDTTKASRTQTMEHAIQRSNWRITQDFNERRQKVCHDKEERGKFLLQAISMIGSATG